MIQFQLHTSDDLNLFGRGWEPDGSQRAVVCLVHGLAEHSGRYAHIGTALTRGGYALLSNDLRGHGKSEGQRGHSPSFSAIHDDTALLLAEADRRYPGQPKFLYGHSLGGSLVLDYVLQRRPQLAGVIATGPLLRPGFDPPAWKIQLGKIMRSIIPSMTMFNEIDAQAVSRDPEVVRDYIDDPLRHDRISARLAIDMLETGLDILGKASGFPLPLLLMVGGSDRLVSVDACKEFAAKAGEMCTLRVWDGLYHEVHNEPEQEQVLDFLLKWLSSRT